MAYYRLYFFNPRSHGIVRVVEIEAEDDSNAEAAAHDHRGEQALELWCGTRRVLAIEATDLASRVIAAKSQEMGGPAEDDQVAD